MASGAYIPLTQTHTHAYPQLHMKVISRNQVRASRRPACAWLKNHSEGLLDTNMQQT